MPTHDAVNAADPSQYSPPERIQPVMACAECKAFIRTAYLSLNERPMCVRCGNTYRERIERGVGPGSMQRAVLYGAGAALAGFVAVAILLSVVGAFRIIASIGVAWLIATAIGKATGNYGGRRYQVLAVALTYLALGSAMLVPVVRAVGKLDAVVAPPKLDDRTGPAGQQAALQDELNALAAQPDEEGEDPAVTQARIDSIAQADSIQRLEQTRENLRASDGNVRAAERLSGGVVQAVVGAVTMLVVLPLLSSFMYGIYAGVFGIIGLGYAMKRAWDMTELVTEFELTGPYKVGDGPIAPRVGG